MTIRRRETVDEHARTIFIFLFYYTPLSFISLEKIIRFGICVYMWSSTGDQIPGAGLSGGRVQETRNRRSPSDGEWGIIARLRSLREEDSMAASTTPGSNYRISPPSSSPLLTSNPRYTFPRPFISLRLDVLLFGVCTYRLGERPVQHLSLSLSQGPSAWIRSQPDTKITGIKPLIQR